MTVEMDVAGILMRLEAVCGSETCRWSHPAIRETDVVQVVIVGKQVAAI